VHKRFAKWPLGRRIVALAAAYAIVLSSLFANLGAAQAAVAAASHPGFIICHSDIPGQPPSGGDNGKTCVNGCCIGCLMLMATLPAPQGAAVPPPLALGQTLKPQANTAVVFRSHGKSHLSRAPPFGA
jgi:hypothetical protein